MRDATVQEVASVYGRGGWLALALLLAMFFSTRSLAASTELVLYAFRGGTDGAYPSSSLIWDASGNLYGTTSGGGNLSNCLGNGGPGCGVVFELTRFPSGERQESVLYAFQGGPDGQDPTTNLVFDTSGNLYGTTVYGGTDTSCGDGGCGTVFQLSPTGNGGWTKTTIHDFQAAIDGGFPAGLTIDASGNLYGVTTEGAVGRQGAVYELSPPKQPGGPWTEEIIYNFSPSETPPQPGLIFDKSGNLYGTYSQRYGCYVACGAVFQLTPAQGFWTETDLFDFAGGGNGGEPMAGVILDDKGNLYGTGAEGGNNWGIAFELELKPGKTPWTGIMLHNFCSKNNCADGATPQAPLVMDSSGALYGTTVTGGRCLYNCPAGVVFKLTRTRIKNVWSETVLYSFQGAADGGAPAAGLILDVQDNLYGTTPLGGNSYGTVFEVMQ